MLDRKVAPPIQQISDIYLPRPKKHLLDNGIPVYEVKLGTQEVLKLEVVFRAGRPYERKHMVGRATARLLREGTTEHSAAEIAEILDFYGGSLNTPINLDTSNFILYSLSKHFDKLLPLFSSILTRPAFPEEELKAFIERHQQRLQVDLSKNDVVAYRTITELIFGSDHPYGYNSSLESYAALTREDLMAHFQQHYNRNNCYLFISGKTEDRHIELLNEHFSNIPTGLVSQGYFPTIHTQPQQLRLQQDESLQTAIRIGRRLFNRHHPDYKAMYVLNTIYGGYFGSRLMANIREDKGYTYNIYSSAETLFQDGYFCIGTEVSNDMVEPTRKEIYAEMERMKTELVKEEELQMVRNYLLGNLLTSLDGAFNVSEIVRVGITEGLSFDNFEQLAHTIRHISAEELRALAQRFFSREEMWEVIVGQ
ncbi:MAG: pitrilysin family protein [Bacteroidota bacterium]